MTTTHNLYPVVNEDTIAPEELAEITGQALEELRQPEITIPGSEGLDEELRKEVFIRANFPPQLKCLLKKAEAHAKIGRNSLDYYMWMPANTGLSIKDLRGALIDYLQLSGYETKDSHGKGTPEKLPSRDKITGETIIMDCALVHIDWPGSEDPTADKTQE